MEANRILVEVSNTDPVNAHNFNYALFRETQTQLGIKVIEGVVTLAAFGSPGDWSGYITIPLLYLQKRQYYLVFQGDSPSIQVKMGRTALRLPSPPPYPPPANPQGATPAWWFFDAPIFFVAPPPPAFPDIFPDAFSFLPPSPPPLHLTAAPWCALIKYLST